MLIDRDQRLPAAPVVEATAPKVSTSAASEIRSPFGGSGGEEDEPKSPEPPTAPKPEKDAPSEKEYDEELDESFPASDPPSSTQP